MPFLIAAVLQSLTDAELQEAADAIESEQQRRDQIDDNHRRAEIRAGRGDPGPRR
jgi:hypothetical protein